MKKSLIARRSLPGPRSLLRCARTGRGPDGREAGREARPPSAPAPQPRLNAELLAGLAFRNIGPAIMSGRISDIVIHPLKRHTWYVAVGSGGVWKTENAGTTWTPVFDAQPSYSIGCVTLDPSNPETVWVGTGENVSGRHVGFGDGVYQSLNGGKTWTNMGLAQSEHIGRILVDPRDSERRLRRGRGAALVGGRRARPLQDGRRRQDLGARPRDLEGHGRHVGRVRSRRTRTSSTPRPTSGAASVAAFMGGGPESGIHKSDDARQDLAQAHRGPAQGRRRQDRPGRLAHRPARRLRHGRGRAGGEGLLPVGGPGRELGEAQRLHQRRHGARTTTRRSSPTRPSSTASTRWTRA
ncbi:MAG: hypothetical protein MZV63_66530 [Marinilabiliales bacterium]|nr:hypothetical protein [Marinilabiliales bacterium]